MDQTDILKKLIALKGMPNQSNLPRNKVKTKKIDLEDIDITLFNQRCKNEGINELTFRSVKLIRQDGLEIVIDADEIKGNLKANLMVIKIRNLTEIPNSCHKLIEIHNNVKLKEKNKAEADKKNLDKMTDKMTDIVNSNVNDQSIIERESISEETKSSSLDVGDDTSSSAVVPEESRISRDSELVQQPLLQNDQSIVEAESVSVDKKESIKENSINELSNKKKRKNEIMKRKYERKLQREEVKKETDPSIVMRNTYFKSCLSMLQTYYQKVTIPITNNGGELDSTNSNIKLVNYVYCELIKEVAPMIITVNDIWMIKVTKNDYYYVIAGMMEPLSSIINTIDASYYKEQSIPDHENFFEKMAALESSISENKTPLPVLLEGSGTAAPLFVPTDEIASNEKTDVLEGS